MGWWTDALGRWAGALGVKQSRRVTLAMAMEKAEEPNMHATMNVENIRPYGGTCARGGSLPS